MDVLRGERISLREIWAEHLGECSNRYAGDYEAFTALRGVPPHPIQTNQGSCARTGLQLTSQRARPFPTTRR